MFDSLKWPVFGLIPYIYAENKQKERIALIMENFFVNQHNWDDAEKLLTFYLYSMRKIFFVLINLNVSTHIINH